MTFMTSANNKWKNDKNWKKERKLDFLSKKVNKFGSIWIHIDCNSMTFMTSANNKWKNNKNWKKDDSMLDGTKKIPFGIS